MALSELVRYDMAVMGDTDLNGRDGRGEISGRVDEAPGGERRVNADCEDGRPSPTKVQPQAAAAAGDGEVVDSGFRKEDED